MREKNPAPRLAREVEGAGFDEVLEDLLVHDLPVEAVGEVFHPGERSVGLALGDDRGHGGGADVLDGAEAVADGAAAGEGVEVALWWGAMPSIFRGLVRCGRRAWPSTTLLPLGGELEEGAVDVGGEGRSCPCAGTRPRRRRSCRCW